jgi:heptosyltransferase-2
MNGAARTLVISPNWIGDAVMAQSLLQRLKRKHPERAIDVLAPPSVAPVWRAVAEVDSVLETPFRHGALQLKERWAYGRLLRERGYRDAYVLPNTIKYALIPWFAGIPKRVGYKGEMRYGLLNVIHHDDVPARPMIPFYAALADDPAQPPVGAPRPRMGASSEQVAAACAKAGIAMDRPLVVFAPGAEFGPSKRWPAAHFGQLARAIFAAVPAMQVVLLGSPKDRPVCEEVMAATGHAGMFNMAGATRLDEAIALIARADAVVSNDSGLMHVASALNRPVVGLYGSTDPHHVPPFADVAKVITLKLACAPCLQRECPLGHHDCMNKMGADMVWSELRPMLAHLKFE